MGVLTFILDTLSMFAGFGAFIWLAFALILLKMISTCQVMEDESGQKCFAQPTLQAWPRVMKIMALSGAGLSLLICLPFMISSPAFTTTNIIIFFACMLLGMLYLRHFTLKATRDLSKRSMRHCIIALFVCSGALAAIVLVGIVNPIFGNQPIFHL